MRYAGYPASSDTRLLRHSLGNYEGWMPIFRDERTYSFTTNVTKIDGPARPPRRLHGNFLYLNHWQPEIDNPRGRFDFTTRNIDGAARRRADEQLLQPVRGVPARHCPARSARACRYEEMTGREWQHGLFIRDRWTSTDKLTLDLGLRWEYYPIMHRADRGLERLDLQTLDVLRRRPRRQPEERRVSRRSKDNFAPRLGVVYRLNENTVFRTGYGITYNPIRGRARCAASTRRRSRDVLQQRHVPAATARSTTGIPLITGPGHLSSGSVPAADRGSTCGRPSPATSTAARIQSWNVVVERRLPWDLAVDIAYVGTKGDGGYADLDINAPPPSAAATPAVRMSSRSGPQPPT